MTTSNFSFMSFLENNGGSTYATNSVRKPSPKMITFYKDLCKRKRIAEKDINHLSSKKLSKWIEMINALPDPASDGQINKIKELITEINEAGGNINISEEEIAKLTGGREGTASKLIENLFQKRKELGDNAKPSEAQVKTIVGWFLCPDIPFEAFCSEIIHPVRSMDDLEAIVQKEEDPDKKWELIEELTKNMNDPVSETITITINRKIDLGNGMWTRMTPDVFAEEVRSKLTKKQASKFIDEYRGVFFEWQKTRITKEQVRHVRELELRLANISKPKTIEFNVDINGEISQAPMSLDGDWNPMAYTPMDDLALAQFSYKEASQFIDQLKSEISRGNSYTSMYGEEELVNASENNGQNKFEQKFLIRQGNKRILDETDAKLDEFNKLNDLIFAVESILGYEDQEAHDAVQEIIMDEEASSSKIEELKDYLGNFFMETVTANPQKNQREWASQMARIFNMCEEIPVALKILERFNKREEESLEDDLPFLMNNISAHNVEINMPF